MMTLVIGNKNYSSWSMRGWLLVKLSGVDFVERGIKMYREGSRDEVRALGGETGLVPVLLDGGQAIWDTLAILEYLYEASPRMWPRDRMTRAYGRSVAAEIHSGLHALRSAMPVNLRGRGRVAIAPEVQEDIDRVLQVWHHCLRTYGGPWLLGEYSALDCMYAPVATRFRSYGVTLQGQAAAYAAALLSHPHVAEWVAAGVAERETVEMYDRLLPA